MWAIGIAVLVYALYEASRSRKAAPSTDYDDDFSRVTRKRAREIREQFKRSQK
jgi:hypothetical protein